MYSTWKIAFDRAWAGPSWISWASRDRSASWASTMRIRMSEASGAVARLRHERSVATAQEEPGAFHGLDGQLQPGELRLVLADLGGQRLDLGVQDAPAGVVDAGLRRSFECVDLRAQRPVPPEQIRAGVAVPVAHSPQRVRAVPDGGDRLGVESVDAAVSSLGAGTCGIHRRPSIRVAIHGQPITYTRTSSNGSGETPGAAGPRSSGV